MKLETLAHGMPPRLRYCGEIVSEALARQHSISLDPWDYNELYIEGQRLMRSGQLHGSAALCLVEPTKHGFFRPLDPRIWTETQESPPYLFHGSPISPDEMGGTIEPKTCVFATPSGKITKDPPCSSHSSSTLFPKIRALLHADQPALKGMDELVLARRRNKFGHPYSITFRKIFDRLVESEACGWVYTSQPHSATFSPILEYADQKEYRTGNPVQYWRYHRISMKDLPSSVIVLDGPEDTFWPYLDTLKYASSFIEHALQFGITALYASEIYPELAATNCLHNSLAPASDSVANPISRLYDFRLYAGDEKLAAADDMHATRSYK